MEELQDVVDDILVRYPQVELYLKSKHMRNVNDLLADSEGNARKEVDIEAFKLALSEVDSQMKTLPATAQVLGGFTDAYNRGFCLGTQGQWSACLFV